MTLTHIASSRIHLLMVQTKAATFMVQCGDAEYIIILGAHGTAPHRVLCSESDRRVFYS